MNKIYIEDCCEILDSMSGHPAVVEKEKKFLFQRHIAYLKPKRELINSYYLHGALLSPDGQRQVKEKVKGDCSEKLESFGNKENYDTNA